MILVRAIVAERTAAIILTQAFKITRLSIARPCEASTTFATVKIVIEQMGIEPMLIEAPRQEPLRIVPAQ